LFLFYKGNRGCFKNIAVIFNLGENHFISYLKLIDKKTEISVKFIVDFDEENALFFLCGDVCLHLD